MEKNKRIILLIVTGMLAVVLLLSAMLAHPTGAARWPGVLQGAPAHPAVSDADSLSGVYVGQVALEYAVPGAYSDLLPTPDPDGEPPPELGSIDLGLQLTQDGTALEGYVDLEYTLVFTTEHMVDSTAFGPKVTGSLDGENLVLESERVSLVSAGQPLMRQFRLTGVVTENELNGEYRETLWGYGSQPLTIVGSFSLLWTTSITTESSIFLPVVSR